MISGISKYTFRGKKNDETVNNIPKAKIPVKIFPAVPSIFSPKTYSVTFPQPKKVVKRNIVEQNNKSIKKDCLKISNLSCF